MDLPDKLNVPWLEFATVANILKGHLEMVSVPDLKHTLETLNVDWEASGATRKEQLLDLLMLRVEELNLVPPFVLEESRQLPAPDHIPRARGEPIPALSKGREIPLQEETPFSRGLTVSLLSGLLTRHFMDR